VADSKQEESFKVIDRRLFTEQGELRKEAVDEERRNEDAAKKAAASPAAPAKNPGATAAKSPIEAAGLAGTGESDAARADVPTEDAIEPSHNFQMLVDFITRNAAAMLGGMTDPRTGKAFVDLEGAREMIDMLDVLREKTRGNLAKVDDDLLIEVIGSLKLSFMEISKAASEAMAKKAGEKK
jgi:Domain of unknown function (DUF1844)